MAGGEVLLRDKSTRFSEINAANPSVDKLYRTKTLRRKGTGQPEVCLNAVLSVVLLWRRLGRVDEVESH